MSQDDMDKENVFLSLLTLDNFWSVLYICIVYVHAVIKQNNDKTIL